MYDWRNNQSSKNEDTKSTDSMIKTKPKQNLKKKNKL